MITDKETDIIYFSDLLKEKEFKTTLEEIQRKLDSCYAVYKFLPKTRDIWARDYMPIQISDHKFLEYRYDPDYLRKEKIKSNFTQEEILTIENKLINPPVEAIKSLIWIPERLSKNHFTLSITSFQKNDTKTKSRNL